MPDEFGFYNPSAEKNISSVSDDNFGFAPVSKNEPGKLEETIKGIMGLLSGDVFGLKPGMPRSPVQQAAKILPVLGEDIGKSIKEFSGNFPGYVKQAPSEIGGLLSMPFTDPGRTLKVLLAGGYGLEHKLLNLPHSMAKYGEHAGIMSPEQSERVPHLQEDISPYINKFLGNETRPGEKLLRGIIENPEVSIPGIGLASKIVTAPLKLTAKNVMKDVLKGEKKMKEKYSGEKGLYTQLFSDARKQGFGTVEIPKNIDLETIKKYSTDKNIMGLKKFLEENTIENSQKALSDLGHITRNLEKKSSLTEAEKTHYQAAKNAQDSIQQNMFKDLKGNINEDFLGRHKTIQQGYANEVIPYTTNPVIKAYKKNEIKAKEAVSSLNSGKFSAKRGKFHKNIERHQHLGDVMGTIGKIGSIPLMYGAMKLIDHLLNYNKQQGQQP